MPAHVILPQYTACRLPSLPLNQQALPRSLRRRKLSWDSTIPKATITAAEWDKEARNGHFRTEIGYASPPGECKTVLRRTLLGRHQPAGGGRTGFSRSFATLSRHCPVPTLPCPEGDVLTRLLEMARMQGRRLHRLPELRDIDRVRDLEWLAARDASYRQFLPAPTVGSHG